MPAGDNETASSNGNQVMESQQVRALLEVLFDFPCSQHNYMPYFINTFVMWTSLSRPFFCLLCASICVEVCTHKANHAKCTCTCMLFWEYVKQYPVGTS